MTATVTVLHDPERSAHQRAAVVLHELSDRELDILTLMAEGCTNGGICDRLCLSPRTVETHVRHIYIKLDLRPGMGRDRRVLAVIAYLDAHPAVATAA
jgi:DNA-binding NarL/FixJ family response regulator